MDSAIGPELVVGIVSAIGVANRPVTAALSSALASVGYKSQVIDMIGLAYRTQGLPLPTGSRHERYHALMTAGNQFRARLERRDAIALAALAEIRALRKAEPEGTADRPIQRCAFILRSLKTPDEIDLLRRVYGTNCIVLAAYMGRRDRIEQMRQLIADDVPALPASDQLAEAVRLIQRDEREQGERWGQDLAKAFSKADVFVAARDQADLDHDISRVVDLLFGHPFISPRPDEMAMSMAFGAALRSASPAHQVGAAIATQDGDLVSTGTNEVAKAFGGQYWDEAVHDGRDHARQGDTTTALGLQVVGNFLARQVKKGWLSPEKASLELGDLVKLAVADLEPACADTPEDPDSLSDKALVFGLLEFIRAVHAEMAAIVSAANRGVAIRWRPVWEQDAPGHGRAPHRMGQGETICCPASGTHRSGLPGHREGTGWRVCRARYGAARPLGAVAMDKNDRLYRVLQDAREQVGKLEDWQRSSDTNRELRRLAEEQARPPAKKD